MLLAVGAIPSMSSDIHEIGDFVRRADALLINLGTLDTARKLAIEAAIDVACEREIPWILDPVLIDRAPTRLAYARQLMNKRPSVIRGNAAEMLALGGDPTSLARETKSVVAITGAIDLVTNGHREITIESGHPLMGRVTGIGCAGTALIAAFCAADPDKDLFAAVVAGLRTLGEAGEKAAEMAPGPGGFAAALLDQIYFASQPR